MSRCASEQYAHKVDLPERSHSRIYRQHHQHDSDAYKGAKRRHTARCTRFSRYPLSERTHSTTKQQLYSKGQLKSRQKLKDSRTQSIGEIIVFLSPFLSGRCTKAGSGLQRVQPAYNGHIPRTGSLSKAVSDIKQNRTPRFVPYVPLIKAPINEYINDPLSQSDQKKKGWRTPSTPY
jgi:hypothetical protein